MSEYKRDGVRGRRGLVLRLAGASLAAVALAAGSLPSFAGSVAHPGVVSDDPANFTPHLVSDDTGRPPRVHAYAQHGQTMYAGGIFSKVENAKRTETYTRQRLVAFNASTGEISTGFAPSFNAAVWSLLVVGDSLYVGGEFSHVDGVERRALVKFDLTTGQVDPTFKAPFATGRVTDMELVGNQLIVGGTFPKRLMSVNQNTGAGTAYLQPVIAGKLANSSGKTEVFRFSVNAQQTRLVAIGNFETVNGVPRRRAFMLNLEGTKATLNDWYYAPLDRKCLSNGAALQAYLRDVDFAPSGEWFVLVSSGYVPATQLEIGTAVCDAAARFEIDIPNPAKPTWINYTGGDTLTSVAVTGAAVYVQGHSRWLDNPYGKDSKGPGAVDRLGGGAIHPNTGMALAWNPIMPQRIGGYAFLATPDGLWMGTDGQRIHGEYRRGIRFMPLVP